MRLFGPGAGLPQLLFPPQYLNPPLFHRDRGRSRDRNRGGLVAARFPLTVAVGCRRGPLSVVRAFSAACRDARRSRTQMTDPVPVPANGGVVAEPQGASRSSSAMRVRH